MASRTRTRTRRSRMTEQIVFRAPTELYEALQRDAENNGRTVAQSARFHLARTLQEQPAS